MNIYISHFDKLPILTNNPQKLSCNIRTQLTGHARRDTRRAPSKQML